MNTIEEQDAAVKRLFHVVKKLKRQIVYMKPTDDIRMSEFMILHRILSCVYRDNSLNGKEPSFADFSGNGVTVSELSSLTQQTPSSVSQIIKALEKKQLVVRNLSRTDRRIVYVNLSEHGWEILCHAEKAMFDRLNKITDAYGAENTDQLIVMLEKLADVMDTIPPPRLPCDPVSQPKGMI